MRTCEERAILKKKRKKKTKKKEEKRRGVYTFMVSTRDGLIVNNRPGEKRRAFDFLRRFSFPRRSPNVGHAPRARKRATNARRLRRGSAPPAGQVTQEAGRCVHREAVRLRSVLKRPPALAGQHESDSNQKRKKKIQEKSEI